MVVAPAATVAFLGPLGTFTYQAARNYFGVHAHYLTQPTIEDVFTAVEKGTSQYGVVPIENSSAGTVGPTLQRLLTSARNFKELPNPIYIRDQAYLPISQCLLSRCSSLSDIRVVYSHAMGFKQCTQWLARTLPQAEHINVSSTARAAELASNQPHTAAIGSAVCAQVFPIQVLSRDIQDANDNVTRFFILSRTPSESTGNDQMYLSFTVNHSQPGSLGKALTEFRQNQLNLSMIDSIPANDRPWHYYFLVESTGHHRDPQAADLLCKLRSICEEVHVFGSYPYRRCKTVESSS
ncbi:prephenate dehydratase [Dispira parvispora]|uniref:prephenate dehydratase n=1 Tax=Dispira parvispora TaxID=1520584 RepID=A0A9W8AW15_9FUNG|nr:prephenate dehydratase [Dispira parvispora]